MSLKSLLLLVKDTKFESKSQLTCSYPFEILNCFYWSKIQNLKANHNNYKDVQLFFKIAFTGQRYKIWKQITTNGCGCRHHYWLLLLVKDTKFESKSQLTAFLRYCENDCFYWSKIQNLKANHNHNAWNARNVYIAFTGQRYKIWKQITTARKTCVFHYKLLLLVKDTKFESKSQLRMFIGPFYSYCFYWSKIQNLKANHNKFVQSIASPFIAFTGQRYKIWKQITTCIW